MLRLRYLSLPSCASDAFLLLSSQPLVESSAGLPLVTWSLAEPLAVLRRIQVSLPINVSSETVSGVGDYLGV
jgi:hypothetical protein